MAICLEARSKREAEMSLDETIASMHWVHGGNISVRRGSSVTRCMGMVPFRGQSTQLPLYRRVDWVNAAPRSAWNLIRRVQRMCRTRGCTRADLNPFDKIDGNGSVEIGDNGEGV